jgi:putative glutamine amidotransferase
MVNTRHIQAVASVGAGLKASLHAEDGCIEGIEDNSGLILGVQFHPERMGQETQGLFEALVESARQGIPG